MEKTLLVIDFNNILYKSLYAYKDLSFNEYKTGGIYGWVMQFCRLVNRFNPDKIIIGTDSPPYFRNVVDTNYKSMRNKLADTEFMKFRNDSLCYITGFLKTIDFKLIRSKGFEFDDIAYFVCEKYIYTYRNIIIASNDSDLYQLFFIENNSNNSISLYNGRLEFKRVDFDKRFAGFDLDSLINYLAIVGTHNGIKGIQGIGDKKAIMLLSNEAKWSYFYKNHRDIIDFNTRLIKLPYVEVSSEYSKSVSLYRKSLDFVRTKTINRREVYAYLSKFGIQRNSTITNALEILKYKVK